MTFEQIISDIKKKIFQPIYFLMGEEAYFIDEITDAIETSVLTDEEKEFNQTILYGKDVDAATITSAAKRFPMMANYQLVIVKEAQQVKDLVSKSSTEEAASKNAFANYLKNPQKSTVLVLCYKYKTIDKRTSLAKQLSKNALVFESKKLYDNQVPDWINNYLSKKKLKINPKASVLLAEYVGNDLGKLTNELNKLILNLPENTEINSEHIQQNIGISKEYNVFELQTALGNKNILKANRIINHFAANTKNYPLVVTISSLYNYYSKILTYHYLADKSKNNVAVTLGVHPFFVSDYEKAAKNYSAGKLIDVISFLREYDLKSKGYDNISSNEADLLKELIFKILH